MHESSFLPSHYVACSIKVKMQGRYYSVKDSDEASSYIVIVRGFKIHSARCIGEVFDSLSKLYIRVKPDREFSFGPSEICTMGLFKPFAQITSLPQCIVSTRGTGAPQEESQKGTIGSLQTLANSPCLRFDHYLKEEKR